MAVLGQVDRTQTRFRKLYFSTVKIHYIDLVLLQGLRKELWKNEDLNSNYWSVLLFAKQMVSGCLSSRCGWFLFLDLLKIFIITKGTTLQSSRGVIFWAPDLQKLDMWLEPDWICNWVCEEIQSQIHFQIQSQIRYPQKITPLELCKVVTSVLINIV